MSCQHFGLCGGCDWQHLSYPDQLARKHQDIVHLLNAGLRDPAPRVDAVIGMQPDASGWPWHSRHKASFAFGDAENGHGSVLGHYAANSRRVIPIVECPVHTTRANHLAFALHERLQKARVSAAGPALRGVLRHLIVRTTRDEREAVAMLVVTRNDKSLRAPIRAMLGTEDAPDGFYLNIHDKPSAFMIGRETIRLAGRSHIRERVAGVSFLISPTAFFQTNVEAAEALVQIVLAAAPEPHDGPILDLYAGSGLFTLALAARGHRVTAIEENPQAIDDAEANVRLNRIAPGHVRLHAARVEDALRRVERESFSLVILDPPRQGCPPAVLNQVFNRMRPPRVIYVSCNPEAFAAEAAEIVASGYEVRRVQPVDMFPHTTHVEMVVTLERRRTERSPRAGRQRLSATRQRTTAD